MGRRAAAPEYNAGGREREVPADGGFLVYPGFASEIMLQAYGTGAILAATAKFPIGGASNSVKIPTIDEQSRATGSRLGGVQGFWKNESDQPSTLMTIRPVRAGAGVSLSERLALVPQPTT
jgi:hypothetical protein